MATHVLEGTPSDLPTDTCSETHRGEGNRLSRLPTQAGVIVI